MILIRTTVSGWMKNVLVCVFVLPVLTRGLIGFSWLLFPSANYVFFLVVLEQGWATVLVRGPQSKLSGGPPIGRLQLHMI